MKKVFSTALGALLILFGVICGFIPFLQGWVFILMGLTLISPRLAERWKLRLWRRFSKKDILVIEEWERFGARAGLTTRHFAPAFAKTDDLAQASNQALFMKTLSESPVALAHGAATQERFVYLNQVHGDHVAVLDDAASYEKPGFYRLPATDGVITNIPGLSLLVFTADCLPVTFCVSDTGASGGGRGWVGLAHAGWRGTRFGIAAKTLRLILQRSGAAVHDVHAVFGPSICARDYEVGPEFREHFPGSPSLREKKGRLTFDLAGENRRQLREAGLPEKNITDLHICTVEEPAHFYSHRRDKASAARMISYVFVVK